MNRILFFILIAGIGLLASCSLLKGGQEPEAAAGQTQKPARPAYTFEAVKIEPHHSALNYIGYFKFKLNSPEPLVIPCLSAPHNGTAVPLYEQFLFKDGDEWLPLTYAVSFSAMDYELFGVEFASGKDYTFIIEIPDFDVPELPAELRCKVGPLLSKPFTITENITTPERVQESKARFTKNVRNSFMAIGIAKSIVNAPDPPRALILNLLAADFEEFGYFPLNQDALLLDASVPLLRPDGRYFHDIYSRTSLKKDGYLYKLSIQFDSRRLTLKQLRKALEQGDIILTPNSDVPWSDGNQIMTFVVWGDETQNDILCKLQLQYIARSGELIPSRDAARRAFGTMLDQFEQSLRPKKTFFDFLISQF